MAAKDKRSAVVDLYRSRKTVRENKDALLVSQQFVHYSIKRFRETGEVLDHPRSGRPRSIRTPQFVEKIRSWIRRKPNRSMNTMAQEFNVATKTVRNIVHKDLGLHLYTLLLSAAAKKKRLDRSCQLLRLVGPKKSPIVIWMNEKLFNVEKAFNSHNDRVIASDLSAVPEAYKIIQKRQKPASVIVWAAVADSGEKSLIFIMEEGIRINSQV